jgi:hypothetical protein
MRIGVHASGGLHCAWCLGQWGAKAGVGFAYGGAAEAVAKAAVFGLGLVAAPQDLFKGRERHLAAVAAAAKRVSLKQIAPDLYEAKVAESEQVKA